MGKKNRNNAQRSTKSIASSSVTQSATEDFQTKRTNEIKNVTEKILEETIQEFQVPVLISSSGSAQRRKSGGHHVRNQAGSTSKWRKTVHSYWNSMTIDSKKEFLSIQVSDLISCCASSDGPTKLNEYVAEALQFAEANNKTFKYWLCFKCHDKRFSDSESLTQHVRNKFVGNLLPEMQSVLPQNVEGDWINNIPNYSWKPLDASAALKMLKDNTGGIIEVDWPLSDDPERAKLLEEIHAAFDTLISRECLAASHLNNVIKISMDEIQELSARSQLMNQRLELSPTCICFLGAPQLKKILKFLEDVFKGYVDEGESPIYDLPNISQNPEIKEDISLNEDETCLVLDERLVPVEISPGATDPFLSWIFSGLSYRYELDWFNERKEHRRTQANALVDAIQQEFKHLQILSASKCKGKNNQEALRIVEDLCVEGRNFTVLKRRKEELLEGDLEFQSIEEVLELADGMKNDQSCGKDVEESAMDNYVEKAIQDLKEDWPVELGIYDAEFVKRVTTIKQLELKLDPASAFDFRETLLPIMKSYLRVRLEDLIGKEETKKSDAAAQALLDQVALEASQQDVAKAQESDKKPKDKGKNKQKGKTENLKKKKKSTYNQEEPSEDATTTPGSSSVVPVNDDDKVEDQDEKQDEEEELGLRQKELEQETRELVEELENTKIEEENKKLNEKLNHKLELQANLAKEASEMQTGWQQKKKRVCERAAGITNPAEVQNEWRKPIHKSIEDTTSTTPGSLTSYASVLLNSPGKVENLKKKKAKYDHEQPIEDTTTTPGSSSAVHDKIRELLEKPGNTKLEEEEERKLTEKLNEKLESQTQVTNEASLMQPGWQQKKSSAKYLDKREYELMEDTSAVTLGSSVTMSHDELKQLELEEQQMKLRKMAFEAEASKLLEEAVKQAAKLLAEAAKIEEKMGEIMYKLQTHQKSS